MDDTEAIRLAVEAFRRWCDQEGYVFEEPGASSVHDIDGRRYVRLDQAPSSGQLDPAPAVLAVYVISGPGVARMESWPQALQKKWPGAFEVWKRDRS